jgi:hypothetical protein
METAMRGILKCLSSAAAVAAKIFGGAGMDILGREVIVHTQKGDSFAYCAARMVEC